MTLLSFITRWVPMTSSTEQRSAWARFRSNGCCEGELAHESRVGPESGECEHQPQRKADRRALLGVSTLRDQEHEHQADASSEQAGTKPRADAALLRVPDRPGGPLHGERP